MKTLTRPASSGRLPRTLTLYSRPGCHLCEEMKIVISKVAMVVPVSLEVIDISESPELEGRYGLEIPVLFVDGRKAAKYRVTEAQLRRVLDGRDTDLDRAARRE